MVTPAFTHAFLDGPHVAVPHVPTAPVAEMGGRTTAVNGQAFDIYPSTLETTRQVWLRGVWVPGPIRNPAEFKWPAVDRDFRPMDHQVQTGDFMTVYPRCFILNRPGTGKTASAIWAAEYLMKKGLVTKVVVLCPKSCMEDVWVDELRALNPLRRVAVCNGPTKANAIDGDFEWVIANHDQTRFEPFKSTAPKWQTQHKLLVIVDEATAYRNYRAARTKGLERLTNRLDRTWVWMMTGTPHPKDPTDIYGMCKVLNPASVPERYNMWRDRVMYPAGEFRWKVRADAGVHIRKAMFPAICFRSEDVLELPPRHNYGFGTDVVPGSEREHRPLLRLSQEQEDLMGALKKEAVAEIASLEADGKRPNIVAMHAGVLWGKLRQIAQGVVVDESGTPRPLDWGPRVDDMLDVLASRKKKFLLFSHYKPVLARLHATLNARGLRCEMINGGTSRLRRKAILEAMRTSPHTHGLVAQPGTMAHGITLTCADMVFWFGPPDNPEYWDQGNHRAWRKGQDSPVHIWAQAACKEEADYFDVIVERGDLEQATLNMFRVT